MNPVVFLWKMRNVCVFYGRLAENISANHSVPRSFVDCKFVSFLCRKKLLLYRAVFQSLVEKHFPAFDRRKVLETVGMTDLLEEEAEGALDIEPDADGGQIRKRLPSKLTLIF